MKKQSWILSVGTYPPRECGIATFTRDISTAVEKKFPSQIKSKILAMNRNGVNIYNYPKEVILQMNDTDMQSYIDCAKKVNEMEEVKLVSIQHEFGIFGGEYGSYLITFLELLEKPIIVTFHSVIPDPDNQLKNVVQSIADKVACLIVMTKKGEEILRDDYQVKADIKIIPHGIPTVSYSPNSNQKEKMGYKDKLIISSFGLMSEGKGYEYVIKALPKVVEKFPNLLYLIVGETHPVVRKEHGEEYRTFLEGKIKKLGLENNVKFYNKYLTLKEIIQYLKATDIYVCSSKNPIQITSGTLVYAMGCGKPVISTPFLHAKDIVDKKRGILTKFNDSQSFSRALIKILSDKKLRRSMGKESYYYTRHMTWPNVAIAYMKLFNKYTNFQTKFGDKFPPFKLNHLIKLTDDFGIIQFAKYTKPDISSGYTLDDNARAMIVCALSYDKFRDKSRLNLIKTYLDFIGYVQEKDGKLYNIVNYDRKIDKKSWSEDAHGRALWSLGLLTSIKSVPPGLREKAEKILKKALKVKNKIKSPRAAAFMILGLYFFNESKYSRRNVNEIKRLADWLISLYHDIKSDNWSWFEDVMAYSNSKLPESLFYAYLATKDQTYLKIAESSLDFLTSATLENEMFVPIGNKGWYSKRGKKAYFDQQPVDTASMVQTLKLAYEVTNNEDYLKNAYRVFQWFLGRNSLNQMVYDESTGGCKDGVSESFVNLNQGAESTISYLLARLTLTN